MARDIPCKPKHKKVGVTVLTSEKVRFKTKISPVIKKRYSKIIEYQFTKKIYQLQIYMPLIRASKYMKQ